MPLLLDRWVDQQASKPRPPKKEPEAVRVPLRRAVSEAAAMTAPIEVLAIRKLDGTTTVKAFVDFRYGGVTVKGAKIIRQDGQRAWLGIPAVKGNHGWTNTVELSKPLRERVTEVVLEAWERRGEEPPARQAERGRATAEALEETGAAWSQKERDEHVQELARRFDDREPDQVPF
jgi:hypothetical protein